MNDDPEYDEYKNGKNASNAHFKSTAFVMNLMQFFIFCIAPNHQAYKGNYKASCKNQLTVTKHNFVF